MDQWATILIRFVGMACVLMAGGGFFYNYKSYFSSRSEPFDPNIPYFKISYYSMLAVCLAFYTALLVFGVQFLFLITKYKDIFIVLLATEVLYFIIIRMLWRIKNDSIARSISAATGIANGGLLLQLISGFLLWAPILVIWGHRRFAA